MKSPWKMNVYGITKFVLIFELLVILGLDIIEIYGMRLVFPFFTDFYVCRSLRSGNTNIGKKIPRTINSVKETRTKREKLRIPMTSVNKTKDQNNVTFYNVDSRKNYDRFKSL